MDTNGDLIINSEDAIIKHKDRVKNTLIIGPDNTGRLNQVVLPQLDRDIKKGTTVITLSSTEELALHTYALGKFNEREDVVYFDPLHPDSPYLNPLMLDNEQLVSALIYPSSRETNFFTDQQEMLLRRALTVLRAIENDPAAQHNLYGDSATMIDLSVLINNEGSKGEHLIKVFSQLENVAEEFYQEDVVEWFLENYYLKDELKTFEHTAGLRNRITMLALNPHLRTILNPPKGETNILDFNQLIKDKSVVAVTSNVEWLSEAGLMMNQFIISMLQTALNGQDVTVYIDDFQMFYNNDFGMMLQEVSGKQTSIHLLTENLVVPTNKVGMMKPSNDPERIEDIQNNISNHIVLPGTHEDELPWLHSLFENNILDELSYGEVAYRSSDHQGVTPAEWLPMQLKYELDLIIESSNE